MRLPFSFLVLPLILSACAAQQPVTPRRTPAATVAEEEWRGVASTEDVAKIDGLLALWERSLAAARAPSARPRLAASALLDPKAGLERGAPTPGSYRCKFTRLGKRSAADRPTALSPEAFCYVGVEEGRLSLTTETGSLRLGGWLWEETGGRRLIFLGAVSRPKMTAPPAYGEDRSGDAVGVLERIGEFRFRLAVPAPGGGEALYLFELWAMPSQ
jgi:hypothetical protein